MRYGAFVMYARCTGRASSLARVRISASISRRVNSRPFCEKNVMVAEAKGERQNIIIIRGLDDITK